MFNLFVALGVGWLLGRQGYAYGERGAKPAPKPEQPPLPTTPSAAPWPKPGSTVQPAAAPRSLPADVAPALTKQQKRDWARVQTAQANWQRNQQMAQEERERQRAAVMQARERSDQ